MADRQNIISTQTNAISHAKYMIQYLFPSPIHPARNIFSFLYSIQFSDYWCSQARSIYDKRETRRIARRNIKSIRYIITYKHSKSANFSNDDRKVDT